MALGRVNFGMLDRQGKTSSIGMYTQEINALNLDTVNGQLDTLRNAIDGVTLLNIRSQERSYYVEKYAVNRPTADFAVKGVRWLVRGVDTNGNSVSLQIPGADLSLSNDGETLPLESGPGLALRNALQAVWKSNDGEAVTVQEVVYLNK